MSEQERKKRIDRPLKATEKKRATGVWGASKRRWMWPREEKTTPEAQSKSRVRGGRNLSQKVDGQKHPPVKPLMSERKVKKVPKKRGRSIMLAIPSRHSTGVDAKKIIVRKVVFGLGWGKKNKEVGP